MFKKILIKEILRLNKTKSLDQNTLKKFLDFIGKNKNLIKEANLEHHICVFFLPIDKESKSIFLGHHIKADEWIPPGGHIEKNELPIATVKREFFEELKFRLKAERVDLFDLTIKDVSGNPKHLCKTHYDFWYLVYMKKAYFRFDKGEFYDAKWLSISEGLKRMKLPQYVKVIKKLKNLFF